MIEPVLVRLVAALAFVVPRADRPRWREEWIAELHQVAAARGGGTAMRMLVGAASDAWAIRAIRREGVGRHSRTMTTGITWLDFKLAVRMLVRYPGLTAVGVIGMAAGITIAAGAFGILNRFVDSSLPLDEGDRIVAIQVRDVESNAIVRRVARDMPEWQRDATSVEDIGAFRQISRNLLAEGTQAETVRIAEMNASGFRVARVQPLMGRSLLPADEAVDAAPVLVIGANVWRGRFGGDPSILGRTVQVGDVRHAIVGVMPEGFAFPISHSFWAPLRIDTSRILPRQGPELTVFARLAPGASRETANAEFATIGRRMSASFPQTHAHLRPRVLPYTHPFFDMDPEMAWMVRMVEFTIALLLVVVAVNVAILVYARTASRHGEIAVRTALGASRRRIVTQLFLEALVLASLAAVAGLVLTKVGLEQVHAAMLRGYPMLPFWWTFGLSPGTVAYVALLTVVAAAIVGIVPALKATGRQVQTRLQTLSAGGGGGMRLGRTWTFLIVAQVAFAVALLPTTVFHAWDSVRSGMADPGFPAGEFLTTQLLMDRSADSLRALSDDEFARRYEQRHAELARRLASQSDVSAATFSLHLPGEEATVWVEVEGLASPTAEESQFASGYAVRAGSAAGHEVRFNRVSADFFPAFNVRVLTGRSLEVRDALAGARSVVVNKTFADRIGGHVVGRRLRYVGRSGDARPEQVDLDRWYDIVGVVADFPSNAMPQLSNAKLYHATTTAASHPVQLSLRVRAGAPMTFAGRLRELAADVDPNLQLRDIGAMNDMLKREQSMLRLVATVLAGLTVAVVLLASAGVYAMMSFTIAQRRREIGIRAALGADPRRILASLFSRAFAQLAAGALVGVVAALLLEQASDGDLLEGNGPVVVPLVAAFMMCVGLLAAMGPARRGLRVDPTEALRAE